jgi:hypothetical protein
LENALPIKTQRHERTNAISCGMEPSEAIREVGPDLVGLTQSDGNLIYRKARM